MHVYLPILVPQVLLSPSCLHRLAVFVVISCSLSPSPSPSPSPFPLLRLPLLLPLLFPLLLPLPRLLPLFLPLNRPTPLPHFLPPTPCGPRTGADSCCSQDGCCRAPRGLPRRRRALSSLPIMNCFSCPYLIIVRRAVSSLPSAASLRFPPFLPPSLTLLLFEEIRCAFAASIARQHAT